MNLLSYGSGSQKSEMGFAGLKARLWQGHHTPSVSSRDESISLPFSGSQSCQHSLAFCLYHFNLLFLQSHLLPSLLLLNIPLLPPLTSDYILDHLCNPGQFPHLKVLNHICKVPLPYKVTCKGSRDYDVDSFGGHQSIYYVDIYRGGIMIITERCQICQPLSHVTSRGQHLLYDQQNRRY